MHTTPARFNPRVLLIVAVLLGGLVLGLYALQQRLHLPSLNLGNLQDNTFAAVRLPESLRSTSARYGPTPKPEPVQPENQSLMPPVSPHGASVFPQGVEASAPVTSPAGNSMAQADIQQVHEQTRGQVERAIQQATTQGEKKRRQWGIVPENLNRQEKDAHAATGEKRGSAAEGLIKHAVWARPAHPEKTLYKQQSIPAVTVDTIISDIPGTYKLRVTMPVFDRFTRTYELIPKDSIVIIRQEAVPTFGQKRLDLGVEEIQLPTPEVITFRATVGDGDGGRGVTGKVNNHYGKLALATLISTAINIGGRVVAGNPQGYNYNVAQEMVREAGAQVSQDAKGIVDRVLRIPPTISIPAGTPVSIAVNENIMFSRQPHIVR